MAATTEMILPTMTKGHFVWNDYNNNLEFVSDDVSYDNRDKKKKGKNQANYAGTQNFKIQGQTTFDSPFRSSPMKIPYSAGVGSSKGGARTIGPRRAGSPKFATSSSDTVTLSDVKKVALDQLISEMETSNIDISPSFSHLMNKQEFDGFLISMLHYFTCVFDQIEQEHRPHKTSFLEPSKAEIQALADTKKKMEVTRRKLGQSYCVLILGLGIEKQHHMGCGKKRVSSTHRDKKMFEDLYLFCTYVVWITFRRKELERVKIEVGNMLRSEVFNPALQQKHKASVTAEAKQTNNSNVDKVKKEIPKTEITKPDQKKPGPKPIAERVQDLLNAKLPTMERLTPAQHRRKTGKRPAIRTAIYQRSTALVSLLPLPKEESQYLFQSTQGPVKHKKERGEDEMEFLMPDISSQKIGIIGEHKSLFNLANLMPKNMENEEDNDSENDVNANDDESQIRCDIELNRQSDAISRVTTAEEK
ncbi:protein phosphatase 1 regulatory subunit 36-like isoform X2 [Styela clava]